jgi:putative membrane protein
MFSASRKDKAISNLKSIHWGFLLTLGAGIVTGILLMSRLIPVLLSDYPVVMYSFFLGLIAFSLTIPFRKMHKHPFEFVLLVIFAASTYYLTFALGEREGSTAVLYIFFSGALAICAMILPGISGAYILVILGEYKIILDALHERDLFIVGVFVGGVVLGLMSFVRLLKYILFHYHSRTMASLTGVMLGSMYKLWPLHYINGAPETIDYVIISGAIVAGVFVLYILEKVSLYLHDPEPVG